MPREFREGEWVRHRSYPEPVRVVGIRPTIAVQFPSGAMRASGAAFHSLGDPRCDTGSPHGRLLSTLLPAIAEFEGELSASVLVKAVNVPKLLLSGTNLPATPCCGRIEAVRALSQTSAPVSVGAFCFE